MKQVRILLWVRVAPALGGLAYLLLRPAPEVPPPASSAMSGIGGPFTLVGSDGQPFQSSSRLAGKPHAIFFGFTHCPAVCPTTLQRLVKLRKELGRGDGAFSIVFISVDPERDGPKEVGAYEQAFGGPVIGLTGSPAQIEQVKKQYGIFSRKVGEGSDYAVDHTAAVLLFDRKGGFVGTISAEEQDAVALDKLKRIAA